MTAPVGAQAPFHPGATRACKVRFMTANPIRLEDGVNGEPGAGKLQFIPHSPVPCSRLTSSLTGSGSLTAPLRTNKTVW